MRDRRLPHQTVFAESRCSPKAGVPRETGAGKPADYDAIPLAVRARRGGIFRSARREKFSPRVPATGGDTPGHAAGMTDSRDWVTREACDQYSG